MEQDTLEVLVKRGLSTRQIAKELSISQTNVRHWLNKFALKTKQAAVIPKISCSLCGQPLKQNKYRCQGCNTRVRRYRNKLAAVQLLGGKCVRCGWSGSIYGFQFHHIDPSKKSFTIGQVNNKSWVVIKKELEKCELLCANCHQIEHSGDKDAAFIGEVMNYRGGNDELNNLINMRS